MPFQCCLQCWLLLPSLGCKICPWNAVSAGILYKKCGKEIKGEIAMFGLLGCCIKIHLLETDKIQRTSYLLLATLIEILDTLKCLELVSSVKSLLGRKKISGKSICVVFSHITWICTRRRGSKYVLGRRGIISRDSVQNSSGKFPK